jgi:hypothetical protein
MGREEGGMQFGNCISSAVYSPKKSIVRSCDKTLRKILSYVFIPLPPYKCAAILAPS